MRSLNLTMVLTALFLTLSSAKAWSFTSVSYTGDADAIFNGTEMLLSQSQYSVDVRALRNDYQIVSGPTVIDINTTDVFGRQSTTQAIEVIVTARQFHIPLGFLAWFYDSSGIQMGGTGIDFQPAGSLQPGQRARLRIYPLNPDAPNIVIERL